jgi:hypothetical protein
VARTKDDIGLLHYLRERRPFFPMSVPKTRPARTMTRGLSCAAQRSDDMT